MGILDRLAKSKFSIYKKYNGWFSSLLEYNKGDNTNVSSPLFSPNGTKLETNLIDLYEKIIDINNLKTFRLLEFFHNAA